MHSITNYDALFPFSTIRNEQRLAIEFALDAFLNKNKRFVVLEMGTGCGKSATGVTIARYMASIMKSDAYVLTTQKVLQDQYVNDFGPDKKRLLCSIKSSSNYQCLHYKEQSCGESRRILSKLKKTIIGTDFWNCCMNRCPYKYDKLAFVNSPISITNFSYFLAETLYAGTFEPRNLLIIDECHNIESEIGKFIEVTYSEKFAKQILKCKLPVLNGDDDAQMLQCFEWIKKTYVPALIKHTKRIEKIVEEHINAGVDVIGSFSKQYEMLDKHLCKVNRFIASFNSNWIMNIVEKNHSGRKFEFKPVDVSGYTHDMLYQFGSFVLMMSATVVDHDVFCRTAGLDVNDVEFLRIPSPFPVENKPIHFFPAGKMSIDNIDATLPKMAEIIKMLIDQHHNDKGIIHCVSFKIAQFLFENIKSDRLVIHNTENRDRVLSDHISGIRPTILLSPSMTEGVDLANDASRFQILCKVPFPYLGDKVVKKRKSKDSQWYSFQTAKSVIQAMGRSIRHDTDYAVSYILDADWEYFYKRNKGLFPPDFVNALK